MPAPRVLNGHEFEEQDWRKSIAPEGAPTVNPEHFGRGAPDSG
jgi:hypothetical protein